ncbi:APC family permease [Mycobacterium attenuatum]|uniref:APC family permease n=1 Tax=Mycobacterium attenuatum TaxID=2341086 RepID=UPI000F033412|nr:amino acid permease [Mycobacterium attenuatum]VBA52685.1 L-methionine/branched-chain amino acid exporter YjeH [Mycobacterium attenuatum]
MEQELHRAVGPLGGTAVAISVVVGSGLLVLPGVTYSQHGAAALYAWLLDAAIVLPLLAVFVWLGRRYPGSGGVAGYVRNAFGARAGTATTIVALGTVLPGLSTVAVAGGYHAQELFGSSREVALLGSLGLLAAAVLVNLLGVSVSARAQVIAAGVFVAAIAAAAIGAMVVADPGNRGVVAGPAQIPLVLPALGSVFQAFTGWEMVSCTTGEYRNARRDFPIVVWGSYVLVVILYLLVGLSVQFALTPTTSGVASAPIAALASVAAGAVGRVLFSAIGLVLVFANLVGAVWALSRLVYASARSSLLPAPLARISARGVPSGAVLLTGTAVAATAGVTAAGLIPITVLFSFAGQSFFALYLACLAAFLRLVRSWGRRVLGVVAVGPCLLMLGTVGWHSLYPLALVAIGAVVAWRRPDADLVAAELLEEMPIQHSCPPAVPLLSAELVPAGA